MRRFPPEILDQLKSYVYVYVDPRNQRPFYVGKGCGNRAFSHLKSHGRSAKTLRIRAIRRAGLEPRIDILRFGLTDAQAVLVEAAAIDLVGKARLTNEIRGQHSSFGLVNVKDLLLRAARPARLRHKVVLINIRELYRSDMTQRELYEATRGVWRLKPRKDVELAFAVYQGIVREVYRIRKWYPAGTLEYRTRRVKRSCRWEFDVIVARDVRGLYVGRSVRQWMPPGAQNPIRYPDV